MRKFASSSALVLAAAATAAVAQGATAAPPATARHDGRHQVTTLPLPQGVVVRSGTYTPSGKVLVAYTSDASISERHVSLATVDDDGRNFRPFYSAVLPERPKDNGVRFMIFADNKRIFLGDFVLECTTSLETCKNPALLPVTYPAQVAEGPHVMHRWSEMIIAPDNRHVAWTTLFNNGTAAVFTGALAKQAAGYVIAGPAIVSTLNAFPQGSGPCRWRVPQQVRGGEVKQFIHGGAAISVAGGTERDIADFRRPPSHQRQDGGYHANAGLQRDDDLLARRAARRGDDVAVLARLGPGDPRSGAPTLSGQP